MSNKLVIEKAYFNGLLSDEDYQTHFVEFELIDDTIVNVLDWDDFFGVFSSNRLRLTIEAFEDE